MYFCVQLIKLYKQATYVKSMSPSNTLLEWMKQDLHLMCTVVEKLLKKFLLPEAVLLCMIIICVIN